MSEEKKPIVVGTYNMSFASDYGVDPYKADMAISELSFMSGVLEHDKNTEKDYRFFWNNAKEHLKNFIENKEPLAIGLQEMNIPSNKLEKEDKKIVLDKSNEGIERQAYIDKAKENESKHPGLKNLSEENKFKYGTSAIEAMLSDKYKLYSGVVQSKFKANVSLSIILHENAGELKKMEIVDQKNLGRPLLMLLTDNGNLFVNMHGNQNAPQGSNLTEFNKTMQENIEFLQAKVKEFLDGQKPENIYIMGDFNDRYNHIKKFTINDTPVPLHIEEEDVPKSCCHNWDSSAKDDNKVSVMDNGAKTEYFQGNKDDTYIAEKKKITNEKLQIDLLPVEGIEDDEKRNNYYESVGAKFKIPTEHGIAIENYLNMGDKVFSTNKITSLNIYTGDEDLDIYKKKPSDKSDHELVYAEISPSSEAQPPAAAEAAPTDPAPEAEASPAEAANTTAEGGFFKSLFGGKKKTKKRKSSKKKTKKKRKGKRKGGTKKLNTTHKK